MTQAPKLETSLPPPEEDVREQVERILGSPAFTSSNRRRDFLKFVVEETLAGRASQLKGFSVAVAVLGRDESFDAQTDPVVRLEARRLRRELEHYYLTAGRDDLVYITIPKGGYVPTFELAGGSPTLPEAPQETAPQPRLAERKGAPWLRISGAISVVLAATLLGVLLLTGNRKPGSETRVPDAVVPLADIPVVAVLPLQKVGVHFPVHELPAALTEDIVTDLGRINGLRVIAYGSSARFGADDVDIAAAGAALGTNYLVLGSFQTDGESYRVNLRLVSVSTGQQIWARRYDYSSREILATQRQIAADISTALAVKLLPAEHPSTGGALRSVMARSLYRTGMTVIHPSSDPARFAASRLLFERVIELEPAASHGYAGLAFIEATSLWFDHAGDKERPFEAVDRLASKALAIDASNVHARIAQALAAMAKGEHDQAIEHCRTAIALRPSNSRAHAYLGINLVFAGRAAEAIEPLQEALRLDPVDPRTPFLNMLGVAYLHAGDYAAALREFRRNIERDGPFGPHMLAWIASAHAALGETAEEQAVLTELRSAPDALWVEGWLRRSFKDPRDIEGPLAALAKAGQTAQSRTTRSGEAPGGG